MSELAFPEILDVPAELPAESPATGTAVARIDLKALALTRFGNWRPTAASLVAKFKDVAFAVQTPKGYDEAKKALAEVRAPRYAAQNVSKESKSELAAVSKAVGAEEAAIVAALSSTEAAIKAQIDAEDERRAAEKAEAERKAAEAARLEAERKQRLEDGIATLAGYVGKAEGKTAAQIAGGLDFVRGIRIDADHWQEYTERAAATLAATLQRLEAMHAAQVQAERDAAELAALRAERAARAAEDALVSSLHYNSRRIERRAVYYVQKAITYFEAGAKDWQDDERPRVREAVDEGRRYLAAALAEAMDREAAEAKARAEREAAAVREATRLAAEHEELERERIADLAAGAPKPCDDEPLPDTGYTEGQPAQQVLKAEPATADATDRAAAADASPRGGAMGAGQAAAAAPAVDAAPSPLPSPEPACIRLSAINAAVGAGFTMTSEFISTVLGVTPDGRDKSAVLYTATSCRAIMAALIKRLQAVA